MLHHILSLLAHFSATKMLLVQRFSKAQILL